MNEKRRQFNWAGATNECGNKIAPIRSDHWGRPACSRSSRPCDCGQGEAIDLAMVTLLAGGHALIEGVRALEKRCW